MPKKTALVMSLEQFRTLKLEQTSDLLILKINNQPVASAPQNSTRSIKHKVIANGVALVTVGEATILSGAVLAENNKHVIMDLTNQLSIMTPATSTEFAIIVTTGGTPVMILDTTGTYQIIPLTFQEE